MYLSHPSFSFILDSLLTFIGNGGCHLTDLDALRPHCQWSTAPENLLACVVSLNMNYTNLDALEWRG